MGKLRKQRAEIKRLELIQKLNKEVFDFTNKKIKDGLPANEALADGLHYGQKIIESMIKNRPQDKDLITQAAIRFIKLLTDKIKEIKAAKTHQKGPDEPKALV